VTEIRTKTRNENATNAKKKLNKELESQGTQKKTRGRKKRLAKARQQARKDRKKRLREYRAIVKEKGKGGQDWALGPMNSKKEKKVRFKPPQGGKNRITGKNLISERKEKDGKKTKGKVGKHDINKQGEKQTWWS